MKFNNEWKSVDDPKFGWNLRTAAAVCEELKCGSALSAKVQQSFTRRLVWKIEASSFQSGFALGHNVSMKAQYSASSLEIICTESVRLVNGSSLCSGRLEVRPQQSWSSVCKDGFDQRGAEVVCREISCGALLNTRSELHASDNTPVWRKELKCRGDESTLLDCDNLESKRENCIPVRLTCSEPDNLRLVDESRSCAGVLEMELQDEWKPVDGLAEDITSATTVCRQLHCGFAMSAKIKPRAKTFMWGITASGVESGSALREHVSARQWFSSSSMEIICSEAKILNLSTPDNNSTLNRTALPNISLVRLVYLLLALALFLFAMRFYDKATRGQKPAEQDNIELNSYHLGATRAGGPNEEASEIEL
ncbi:scavenger receptor cysteine-rich type 1 protein M130-like [Xyrichtys novacula]|nr:scavenger receptor cysteine-rich type 1 protein M130-like [Xyrichtys novacula]